MQKLYKFEAISRSENQYKWYKEARAQFYETRQRDAAGRRSWLKICLKIPEFWAWKLFNYCKKSYPCFIEVTWLQYLL